MQKTAKGRLSPQRVAERASREMLSGASGHRDARELRELVAELRELIGITRTAAMPRSVDTARRATSLQELLDEFRASVAALSQASVRPQYRRDQLLVSVKHDVLRPGPGARRAAVHIEEAVERPFVALERDGLIVDVTAIEPTARVRPGARAAAVIAASLGSDVDEGAAGVNLIRLSRSASIEEVRRRLDSAPGVRDVERVPYRALRLPAQPRRGTASSVPWNLAKIGWSGSSSPSCKEVRVAVLDTGVDRGHPALRIASYSTDEVSEEDIVGHGTHVCGILAGRKSTDGKFPGGVCNAELHVWKIFGDEPEANGDYLVDEVLYQRALIAALRAQCTVMNLSCGGAAYTSRERALIARLIARGVTVVAAMGNEYEEGNPTEYPAAFEDVVAVGAVNSQLKRSSFSNTGAHISLVAPGEDVVSTLPLSSSTARVETHYASWAGTSMAAPHVAGAAARLHTHGVRPEDVRSRLMAHASKIRAMGDQAWTRAYGAGLLQLGKPLD